ncbi:hypothetical protein [Plantactinospora endophytica]|uniref:LTXXQ motif family protein n=1 Tax=Plantactinospora endophytica TaxID=673535 RepID=A0ABQ4E657_9ACTN|nr:hypothetical protein [Plantactinospora endophytica]GIG90208.1 hypothetical protein Pen02_51440 [Plantactinospora endophytica]
MSSLFTRKRVVGGLVAAGVLTVGLAAPAVAFAEDATPTPTPSASTDSGKPAPEHGKRWAEQGDKLAEQLAKELGVPQEKVDAALAKIKEQHRAEWKDRAGQKEQGRPDAQSKADREAMLKERLDKAVADGKLTQEQADAILAAAKAGVFPAWGAEHGGWGGPKHGGPADAPATK